MNEQAQAVPTLPLCAVCGKPFHRIRRRKKTCSPNCRHRLYVNEHREQVRRWAAAYRSERRRIARGPGVCDYCGKSFDKRMKYERHCSQRCQLNAYRRDNHSKVRVWEKKSYYTRSATQPWAMLVDAAHFRAKRKGLPCDLTNEWAEARWTGKCELTGLAFGPRTSKRSPLTASIDRIDPALGYVQSNCRFIVFAVNALKGTGSEGEMYAIASALMEYRAIITPTPLRTPQEEAA